MFILISNRNYCHMGFLNTTLPRRSAIKSLAAASISTLIGESLYARISASENLIGNKLKGRVNHSVCRWCYQDIPLEDLCKSAKKIGLKSIELTGPDEWHTLKKYGLISVEHQQYIAYP